MQKSARHSKILELIGSQPISRQTTLAELLRESGFSVTQASVSRDLDELGILKSHGVYTLPAVRTKSSPFGISSIEPCGDNLVVVKCESGLASAVCVKIDTAYIDHVVGTIAGDDTLFIAVSSSKKLRYVIHEIWELFSA